jgi:hypothetical protein
MKDYRDHIREAVCPICNKKYVPAPFHAYKDYKKQRLVCSWSCAVESERRAIANRKTTNKKEKGVTEK